MEETVFRGVISFVNHDKHYATIDYEDNGKKKSVSCRTDQAGPLPKDAKKAGRKPHTFRIGDEVNFQVKRSDKGDKMIAMNVKFLYNPELEKLVNKAGTENRFSGYLKVVDDELFVKEWESYIFFPLQLSKWENPPAESAFNEAISFKLLNTDKPNSIAAELFSHDFIPEYRKAMEFFKSKKPVEGTVTKVSPFAIYIDLFGNNKMQAKIQLPVQGLEGVKPADRIKVFITYLSNNRMVVQPA